MMRKWLAALGMLLFSTGENLVARDQPLIALETDGRGSLTGRQRLDLYGSHNMRPGYYRLKPLHSGKCIIEGSANWPQLPNLIQWSCDHPYLQRTTVIALLPHPSGGYTFRLENNLGPQPSDRDAAANQLVRCASVARGVVFGPPRIDVHNCDIAVGMGDWAFAGVDDQRFDLLKAGPGNYAINPVSNPDQCWAIRDASVSNKADVIRWNCTGGADQSVQFEWIKAFEPTLEAALLNRLRWYSINADMVRLSPANGVELQGPNTSSFETIEDSGSYCMRRCAELKDCKAWVWNSAGFDGRPKPMCHWKSEPGTAVNRGSAAFGKLFSGIVRP